MPQKHLLPFVITKTRNRQGKVIDKKKLHSPPGLDFQYYFHKTQRFPLFFRQPECHFVVLRHMTP